jgi:hypothetical protein
MIDVLLTALSIAGLIPSTLNAVSRVVWVDPDLSGTASCQVTDATHWQCDGLPDPARGIVVMIGDGALAYRCVNVCDASGGGSAWLRAWGRLMVVTPGGVAPDDLYGIRLSAWKPDRSRVRINLRRFIPVEDSGTDVIPLSSTTFWVAGQSTDRDAFIALEGPAIASLRVTISKIAEGPPETPLFVGAAAPLALAGRVESAEGRDVEGSDVELYEPLDETERNAPFESSPMIRRRQTRSDNNGAFIFDRIAAASYLLAVTDSSFGRATTRIESVTKPIVIRLAAPRRATGRVVRNRFPVAGARIRFVPTADVFVASADPLNLIAEETTTGGDGRFSLALPPDVHGVVQAIGPDSASARVPLIDGRGAAEFSLGDIELPEHLTLAVRLLEDNGSCTLSAIGPLSSLGFTIVRGTASGGVHWLDIPEAGEWALDAECGNERYTVQPTMVTVPANRSAPMVDVQLVK